MLRHLLPVFGLLILGYPGLAQDQLADSLASDTTIAYTVFLIGDSGEPHFPKDLNLEALEAHLERSNNKGALIWLGDNIYPTGLPKPSHPKRKEMEKKLVRQLEASERYKGPTFFIPGNHDWQQTGPRGFIRNKEQERFINKKYGVKRIAYTPTGGCPGPVLHELNDSVTLVMLNFQWLLHPYRKPGKDGGCDNKTSIEVLQSLEAVLRRNKDKNLIVLAHHPMYTGGPHGGHYPAKSFLFPMSGRKKNKYIPVPGLGALYPFYRSVIGNIQDIPHPKYKAIRDQMVDMFDEHGNVIFANGHEHSLQHIVRNKTDYIVSGSGSKKTYVTEIKGAEYAKSETGFARLDVHKNGEVKLRFIYASDQYPDGKLDYEKTIRTLIPAPVYFSDDDTTFNIAALGDSITVAATDRYEGKKSRSRWLGSNYRQEWSTPVKVKVMDLRTEKGGLSIVKKGGGMQTRSLRLETKDGKQYVLRSILKFPENAIPVGLRRTFAEDLVQDQISAAHPYAALALPKMADAIGVYHTNPNLRFLPDDPILGKYREQFGNTLMLFEERPNKEHAGAKFFGEGDDIDGTDDVLEELREDNDSYVLQDQVLKSRLFDMVIGDWDRHDDQWRWVEYKDGKGKRYAPIPRDRDQAFFLNEGILPNVFSRRWAMPKVEGFREKIRWSPGFNFNARYFDRTFLNEATKEDWIAASAYIQENLTDEIIEASVRELPPEVFPIHGPEIIRLIKSRRDDLTNAAVELYEFLAEEVEITGSDKHEYVRVERKGDGDVKVTMYKRKKDGEVKDKMYQRYFDADETKEVRIFTFDGEDSVEIVGDPSQQLYVRIISGSGDDVIVNKPTGSTWRNRTFVYDNTDTKITNSDELSERLSDKPNIDDYDRKSFRYNWTAPLLIAQINRDDGLFLGGGLIMRSQAWRKEPYASRHIIYASHALATNAFSINYTGDHIKRFGNWGMNNSVEINQPFFVNNYFGFGNDSENNIDENGIDFYRIRIQMIDVESNLTYPIGRVGRFMVGPQYRNLALENKDRVSYLDSIAIPANEVAIDLENSHQYLGLNAGVEFDNRENSLFPKRGFTFNLRGGYLAGINDRSTGYGNISTSLGTYFTLKLLAPVTFAQRFGYRWNTDDFEFFNANTLGGRDNMRGLRRTRFYGQSVAFHNFDMRITLGIIRTYFFPMRVGLLGFHDIGRVWSDRDGGDNTWHQSVGPGVWVAPLNSILFAFSYGFSEDENLPTFSLGFFF